MSAASQHHEHELHPTDASHAGEHPCEWYLKNLSDYVDGELSEELCRDLEAHLAMCGNCTIVVNTLTRTVTLYRQLPQEEMPDEVKSRLYKVLDLKPVPPLDEPAE